VGHSYRDPWVKKAKWLTQALIISGALNVGLLSTFIYFVLNEGKGPSVLQNNPKKKILSKHLQLGMQELLTQYSGLTFQELLLRLSNNDHIESGYTRRDLALACLVSFHHFNLERALGGLTLQKREITLHLEDQESRQLTIFPGLADYQYQAIVSYAKTEKWPLTPEGLFNELQTKRAPYDPTLLEAFYLTPEFHFLSMLFSKTGIPLKKEHLIALLTKTNWSRITETTKLLRQTSEFTLDFRRKFLLQLIKEESRLAAKILIETDLDYCTLHLDNAEVLTICTLLGDRTTPAYLKELLKSPRSDEIWKTAAAILYEQAAEDIPKTLNLENAKRRFIELKASLRPQRTAPKPKFTTYSVVPGDILWKIARDHSTTIKKLREANGLTNDRLRIGQKLTIPQ